MSVAWSVLAVVLLIVIATCGTIMLGIVSRLLVALFLVGWRAGDDR